MFKKIAVFFLLANTPVFAEQCPFFSNGDVEVLLKNGEVHDGQQRIWQRLTVMVADGATKVIKAPYPESFYSTAVIAGGKAMTDVSDDAGICIYEADIARVEGQPNPAYSGDILRITTKRAN